MGTGKKKASAPANKSRSSTLQTRSQPAEEETQAAPRQRTNTVNKGKPDGRPRQLNAAPPEVEPEVEQEEFEDIEAEFTEEGEEGFIEDEELPLAETSEADETQTEEDVEPMAASEAEEEPAPAVAAEAPAEPRRRGRKPGSTNGKKPAAAAEAATVFPGDLLNNITALTFAVKQLSAAHGKKPEQVLQAIGTIISATEALEQGA